MRLYLLLLIVSAACANSLDKKEEKKVSYSEISKSGFVSLKVVDLATEETVLAVNEDKRLIPASLTKVFTSAAALEVLGTDFRFATRFYLDSSIGNPGRKNLYIVGGGDPSLGSERFNESRDQYIFSRLAQALKNKDVNVIEGDIVVDASVYSGLTYPSKRIWEDMSNYYGAPPHGLSYKENTFRLQLASPQEIGAVCSIVKCEPNIDKDFLCLVRSSGVNKDSAYIYGYPDMNKWYVSGSIPAGRSSFTIKGALPEPDLLFATELRTYLLNNGIKVQGSIRQGIRNEIGKTNLIYTHHSPKLVELCKIINKKSHNLFADHLAYQLAISAGKSANWDNASSFLNQYWSKQLGGAGIELFDGSGLSPFNRFSSSDLIDLLMYMAKSDQQTEFYSSLSVSGQDGTLKRFWKKDDFEGRFVGKSGSMKGVLTYGGYIKTKNDRTLAVCIMVNGFTESYSELRLRISDLIAEIIQDN